MAAPKAKGKAQAKAAPTTGIPETGATAASGSMMMELSELDAVGNRTGSLDRLHANAMTVGSKVAHDRIKGMYEIVEVIQSDAVPAIKLRLIHKRISMIQLWQLLADSRAASGSAPEVVEVVEQSP